MSHWITKKNNLQNFFESKKARRLFGEEFFTGMSPDSSIWLQFTPGIVEGVYLSQTHDIDSLKGATGAIKATSLIDKDKAKKIYQPLLPNTITVPKKGDLVLLCTFVSQNYYLGPLNTFDSNLDKNLSHNNNFSVQEKENLDSLNGDVVINGKLRNSIRLGSRANGSTIFLTNNRNSTEESLLDGSLIALIEKDPLTAHLNDSGQHNILFSSDYKVDENNHILSIRSGAQLFNPEDYDDKIKFYPSDQIAIRSGRISIDSNQESMFLSSAENIYIGAGQNITVFANKEIVLNSTKTYLGKAAKEAEIADRQGLIIGENLRALMEELIDILMEVTGNQSGVAVPLLMNSLVATTELSPFTSRLSNIKTALGKNVNNFVSDKHFIEENEY